MKKLITPSLFFLFLILIVKSHSQIPVIVKDWAHHVGNVDSTFKTPVITDQDSFYTYVASFTVNSGTGADIMIIKYNIEGHEIWRTDWTGSGNGRDQASDIAQDTNYIYVSGITFSSANNFDYVTIKLSKYNGALEWVKTYNGPTSNYDVATAICVDKEVFVTGISNDSVGGLNYLTICYEIDSGSVLWTRKYDYASLMDIPFDMNITNDTIVVVGASQSTLIDWDYANIKYKKNGTAVDTIRTSGTAAGFDRAQAIESDKTGNIYITGTISQTSTGYDIKTIRINKYGYLSWQSTYHSGLGDEGIDLIVDTIGHVYVCGTSNTNSSQNEYVVIKYNSAGIEVWNSRLHLTTKECEAKKMCFDSFGNIIVTGKGASAGDHFDIFTVGLDTSGTEIWRDNYDGNDHLDDGAEDIAADNNGNIYVTGTAHIDGDIQTITIKYRSDYYTDPQQVDTPSVANYFYPNSGQIADTSGESISEEDLHYYTIHHYPQLYFQEGKMNMVFSHFDDDTATSDTLQRVDVSFLESHNATKAYPINEMTEGGYYNYFLAHTGEKGITNVHGVEKLLYENVYNKIDAIYSSNNAGLKLYFICDEGSDPFGKNYDEGNIGLFFEGQDTLEIENNWGLKVTTSVGSYVFEKPRVYQLDNSGNVITLPWQLSWTIPHTGHAKFAGWSSYDTNKPLVIEIGKPIPQQSFHLSNPEWATAFGGSGDDVLTSCTNDADGNFFVTGFTSSNPFPVTIGQLPFNGGIDAIVGKFGSSIRPYPSTDADRKLWTTYFGGTGDDKGLSITTTGTGSTGKIYIVGETSGNISIFGNGNSSSYNQGLNNGGLDGFILRLNNIDGGNLLNPIWSTLIGGMEDDLAKVINSDPSGNIFIGGQTKSAGTSSICQDPQDDNFPLCHNLTSGIFFNTNNGNGDGFLMMFDANENLQLSTFFGGDGEDIINGITIDNNGNVYICGNTSDDVNFPTGTTGIYGQTSFGGGDFDGFVLKLNSDMSHSWVTLFGGSGEDNFNCIDHDSQNNIYLGGRTSSFNPASTNAGTSPCPTQSFNCLVPPNGDYPMCDPGANVFFQDESICNNGSFNGVFDGTITEFGDDGELKWSTYYGGDLEDNISGIAISDDDLIFFTGTTHSQSKFPDGIYGGWYLQSNTPPPTNGNNAFLGHFDSDVNNFHGLSWGTLYNDFAGGLPPPMNESGNAISVFNDGLLDCFWYMVGTTTDPNCFNRKFNCCPNALQSTFSGNSDGLIARFSIKAMWMPGVAEIKNEIGSLRVYPIPTESLLKVNINFNKLTEYSIQIISSTGSICLIQSSSRKVFGDSVELHCDNLSDGIYILRVLSTDGIISSKFIIGR